VVVINLTKSVFTAKNQKLLKSDIFVCLILNVFVGVCMSNRIIAEETIRVNLEGSHRLIERGLDRAFDKADYVFGIDDCCHSDKVPEWDRSSCSIEMEFDKLIVSGSYVGGGTTVVFKARCIKHEEDEEDA